MLNRLYALCGSLTLSLLTTFCAGSGYAQIDPQTEILRRDIDALREGQATIRKELEELKMLLRGRQGPFPLESQHLVVAVDGAPFMGDESAALTLIEFSDLQCPFCARHVRETLPHIERDYIRTGKLKYVVRDFPIASLHPQASKAHEAVRCAAEQEAYWKMYGRLLDNQKNITADDLASHARILGLDVPMFQQCLSSGKHAAGVQMDLAEGSRAGIKGTPSFLLGFTESDHSKVRVRKVIVGAQPFRTFKEAIESLFAVAQP